MLYTILYADNCLGAVIDGDQVDSLVGESDMDKRIDFNHEPRSYRGVFSEPLNVKFDELHKTDKGKSIPDIALFQGRLFLGSKAYEVLKPLIENDGEFLPAVYQLGQGYIYTPLRVAEDIDALDEKLSRKNEWGDVENLAFDETKVADWTLFRARFNAYCTLQCQEAVKDAVESAGLTGLSFTPELGQIFTTSQENASLN